MSSEESPPRSTPTDDHSTDARPTDAHSTDARPTDARSTDAQSTVAQSTDARPNVAPRSRRVAVPEGSMPRAEYVQKVCAYVTRRERELLVFRGPDQDGLQVPKGTVEGDEPLRAALRREIREESGLEVREGATHLATDVWTRRNHPPRRYVRHFYHVSVDEPRDAWCHTVTGTGEEVGSVYEFEWLDLPADREFALALDDYLPLLDGH